MEDVTAAGWQELCKLSAITRIPIVSVADLHEREAGEVATVGDVD